MIQLSRMFTRFGPLVEQEFAAYSSRRYYSVFLGPVLDGIDTPFAVDTPIAREKEKEISHCNEIDSEDPREVS